MHHNAGVDDDFLRSMEKHKQQEYELLQKIALRNGQPQPSPVNVPNALGNLVGSIPVSSGFSPVYQDSRLYQNQASPLFSGSFSLGSLFPTDSSDRLDQQPYKKTKTESGFKPHYELK